MSQVVSMIWLNSEMVFNIVAWAEAPVKAPASATIWSMTRRLTAWPTFATRANSMKKTMKLQRTKRVVWPFSLCSRVRSSRWSFIPCCLHLRRTRSDPAAPPPSPGW